MIPRRVLSPRIHRPNLGGRPGETSSIHAASSVGGISTPRNGMMPRSVPSRDIHRPNLGGRRGKTSSIQAASNVGSTASGCSGSSIRDSIQDASNVGSTASDSSTQDLNSIQVASDVGGTASPRKGRLLRKVLGVRLICLMISNQQQHYRLQRLTSPARAQIFAAIPFTARGGVHYAVKWVTKAVQMARLEPTENFSAMLMLMYSKDR